MHILFLTTAHNSLSQRLLIELAQRGHGIRVCVAASGDAMIEAVSHDAPDLIIAPMLKTAIPEDVWTRVCGRGCSIRPTPRRACGPSPMASRVGA